jgi:Leucine-rich repeat (LRR) protein
LKNIFIFRPDWAECSHNHLNAESQNLKIRPKFLNFTTVISTADIKYLNINFTTSTHIFSGIGETFSTLKELWIQSQSIKFVERSDFAGLRQLENLDLQANQIEFLPEDVFWDLPNLESLSLAANKIKKLPQSIFKNLRKLKQISLFRNKINHLPENLFANNFEIKIVFAENIPLQTIDVDFTALKNLRWLDLLNANCISFFARSATQFQETQRLINQNCTKMSQKNSILTPKI